MVLLNIKKNEESLFMISTSVCTDVSEILQDVVKIQHRRLKLFWLCSELELLCEYGPSLPVEMHGLTDDQIKELHLVDQWTIEHQTIGNVSQNKDVCNKRSGYPPSKRNIETISRSVHRVRGVISGERANRGEEVSYDSCTEAFDILRGAVMIAYPMNLPPYDPIRIEIEESPVICYHGNSAESLDIADAELWFAGKKLIPDKKLSTYVGKNEKSKVVMKLQRKGSGAPTREPLMTEDERKNLMVAEFRRREDLKKLVNDDDDSYFNSNWADPENMKKNFHGLNTIKWKP